MRAAHSYQAPLAVPRSAAPRCFTYGRSWKASRSRRRRAASAPRHCPQPRSPPAWLRHWWQLLTLSRLWTPASRLPSAPVQSRMGGRRPRRRGSRGCDAQTLPRCAPTTAAAVLSQRVPLRSATAQDVCEFLGSLGLSADTAARLQAAARAEGIDGAVLMEMQARDPCPGDSTADAARCPRLWQRPQVYTPALACSLRPETRRRSWTRSSASDPSSPPAASRSRCAAYPARRLSAIRLSRQRRWPPGWRSR